MQYHIFCKETHKYLCTYTNAESLKTLDTTRCYYKEETTLTAYDKLASDTHSAIRKETSSKGVVSSSSQSASRPSSNHNYYSQSYSHTSSDSCSSDSSSSDSSSSSCDSGSY